MEICRFCLKTTKIPLPIDKMAKEIIGFLMLKLDLHITPEPVMCYGCAETLQTAFDFKSACIYTEDCLYPFIEGKSETRLDLREIYLKVNDKEDVECVKGREVCRFCMKPCDTSRCTPIHVIKENVEIKKLLENYFPEVVMGVIDKPVACENCRSFLHQYSLFVTSLLGVEQQIQSHAKKSLGRDCMNEIDLRQVRDISLSNVTKREVETIGNDNVAKEGVMIFNEIQSEEKIISEEKIECEEKEISESKISMASPEIERREKEEFDSFAANDELFTSNQISVIEEAHADVEVKHPFLELLETEVKEKHLEDAVHIEEIKGESEKSQRVLSPHKISECQELEACLGIKLLDFEIKKEDDEFDGNENNTLIPIDPSIIFSGDAEMKPTVVDNFYIPGASHTAIERGPDQNTSEMEMGNPVGHQVKSVEGKIYSCKLCPYKTKRTSNMWQHRLTHKDISEVTTYQCKLCPYKTKRKGDLTKHMLIHTDPSEITTYDCNRCSYKGKRKRDLASHMLVHKDIFKNAPEIETSLPESVEHIEETIYCCKLCPYKSKLKNCLTKHMLVHKDISEVTTYDCSFCPYKTKRKHDLRIHVLVHKDISDVTAYECNFCSYKTKQKRDLTTHMLVHKDFSEVTTYHCNMCPYKTKRKRGLTIHKLIHKDNTKNTSEIETSPPVESVEDVQETIYPCKHCPYKTKRRSNLWQHMLIHKDISTATTYQCKLCPHKTKRKHDLTQHMLVHKNISEVRTYDCNICSYKAKRKKDLTIHMLIHNNNSKNAPEIETRLSVKLGENVQETIYNCKLCPYKTKRINNFNDHTLVHKDISEVTSYHCLLCPYKTKRKGDLTKHMLVHKDISEMGTYDCNICSYKAKRKKDLNIHNLTHKDSPKVTKPAQTQQESRSEHQELEGCSTIKSEEVDIKDEEDKCDDETNKL